MKLKIALVAGLGATLAATAAIAPALARSPAKGELSSRQCFRTDDVRNFATTDGKTVNIRVRSKDVYQFEMFGPCHDLQWNNSMALVSRGSSMICSGVDAEIVTRSTIGPQHCAVRNIRKLTPDEVAALPPKARP